MIFLFEIDSSERDSSYEETHGPVLEIPNDVLDYAPSRNLLMHEWTSHLEEGKMKMMANLCGDWPEIGRTKTEDAHSFATRLLLKSTTFTEGIMPM